MKIHSIDIIYKARPARLVLAGTEFICIARQMSGYCELYELRDGHLTLTDITV